MARAKIKVAADTIPASEMAAAVDYCFDDLVQNIPALRETEHYNKIVAARDALKSTLINTQEATS